MLDDAVLVHFVDGLHAENNVKFLDGEAMSAWKVSHKAIKSLAIAFAAFVGALFAANAGASVAAAAERLSTRLRARDQSLWEAADRLLSYLVRATIYLHLFDAWVTDHIAW